MKRIAFFILAALVAASAYAGAGYMSVKTPSGDKVTLTGDACPKEVLAHIPNEYQEMFSFAFATVGGKSHEACWAMTADGHVYIVLDDGRQTKVPAAAFKDEPGA